MHKRFFKFCIKVNVDKCTCAHGAAFYKNIDILEVLIDSKVDITAKDISGKNILHLLCKESFDNSTVGMTSASSEANLADSSHQKHQQAAEPNDSNTKRAQFLKMITRLLVEFSMDPNEKDLSDFTPVMYACEHADVELLDTLFRHNGDINIINSEGITCMLLAIVNSCVSTVKYLLNKGKHKCSHFSPKTAKFFLKL